MDTLERMPFKAKKAVFDKLLEVADVANLSKEERIQYDEALKRYRDYKNTIDYAEEKGILKGERIYGPQHESGWIIPLNYPKIHWALP